MLKIKQKASDSLRILDICIIEKIEKTDNDQLDGRIKKIYCAVIDSASCPVLGEEMYADIIAQAGNVYDPTSYKKLIENSLKVYQKETDCHEKLFYYETYVLYDYEFDNKVSQF